MALKLGGGSTQFKFGIAGDGDTSANPIISRSTQNKYGSEVEIMAGDGEVKDVVYSGAETTLTETQYSTTQEIDLTELGGGSLSDGVITRLSMQYSNEDLIRMETEKLKIDVK